MPKKALLIALFGDQNLYGSLQWEMESPALQCNTTPQSLQLVLVLPGRLRKLCQGTFPLGAQPYSPLSLHGFCTGHSKKAPMPPALHRMPIGGKPPCISYGPSFAESVANELFAPFLFLHALLLLSSLYCFFPQSC